MEPLHDRPELGCFDPAAPFCDFQFQRRRGKSRIAALDRQHRRQRRGVYQCHPGEVHSYRDSAQAGGTPLLCLRKALLQDEEIQHPDHAGLLQIFNELGGRNERSVLINPAHQGLRTGKRAGSDVELGLEVDGEAAIVHCLVHGGGVLRFSSQGRDLSRELGVFHAHGFFGLQGQTLPGKDTVRPGASNTYLLGITALKDRPQTAAPAQKYLAGGVGVEDDKFRLPCAKQQRRAEKLR